MKFVETSIYMTQHTLFTITYIRDFPMMTQHSLFTRNFTMMLKIEAGVTTAYTMGIPHTVLSMTVTSHHALNTDK